MKDFKELDKRCVHEVEMSILEEWKKQDILNKTIENRSGKSDWVFHDGPATANGMPGLHHMVSKFLKDSFCKYQTMKGHRVLRKIGWDTHGLPVEVNVEKKLGFSGKNDIEKYGIKEFNKFIITCYIRFFTINKLSHHISNFFYFIYITCCFIFTLFTEFFYS